MESFGEEGEVGVRTMRRPPLPVTTDLARDHARSQGATPQGSSSPRIHYYAFIQRLIELIHGRYKIHTHASYEI